MSFWINKVIEECSIIHHKHKNINLSLFITRITECVKYFSKPIISCEELLNYIREMKNINDILHYFKNYINYYKDESEYLVFDYFEKIFDYEDEIIKQNENVHTFLISKNTYEAE